MIPSSLAAAVTNDVNGSLKDVNTPNYSITNPFATFTAGSHVNWISNHLDVYPEVECLFDATATSKYQINNTDIDFHDGNALPGGW